MLQEEMDFAPAEGSDPFQDHLRPPPDVQLELIPNLTQHQINCEGLRRTTALLNKATSDLAMTIKYWEDLGHNSDTDLGKTMERKINELTNQKKGLEKQRFQRAQYCWDVKNNLIGTHLWTYSLNSGTDIIALPTQLVSEIRIDYEHLGRRTENSK
ncbi:hypothetical protein CEXT_529481 [Caerostris extrusa]|uniref:Uncharacterized protein n=1 Tax=Caerostris extrusa TaxID=172846 RepID=A0AAV4W4X8_CAEEX|nr:hypothetical protein CEXT_529481 [Caerostris extrusa]